MRVQERRLQRVLGFVARAELVDAEPEDLTRVLLVEVLGRVGLAGGALDVCCTTDGGDCGYRQPRRDSLTWWSRNPPERTDAVWFSSGALARGAKIARLGLVNQIRPELPPQADEQGLQRELGVQVELLQLPPDLPHDLAGAFRAAETLDRRVLAERSEPVRVDRGALSARRDHHEIAVPRCELFERGEELLALGA